jgi:hypothetical protein
MKSITAVPLTAEDEALLAQDEAIVRAGLATFIEVGNALSRISTSRRYRATHSTFAAYVEDTFGISVSYAYRKIEAARVADVVSPIGDIPNEAQARELSGLNEPQIREAWHNVVHEGQQATAASVREARAQVVRPLPRNQTPERRRRPLPDAFRNRSFDVVKVTKSLVQLVRDDRFPANVSACVRSRSEVQAAIDDLATVARALGLGELVLLSPAMNLMGAAEPDVFEAALTEARRRGDLTAEAVADLTTTKCPLEGHGWHGPDGCQPNTSSTGTVIEIGVNTATVVQSTSSMRAIIRRELEVLGTRSMADTRTRLLTFPARYADDLQAALEARHITVTLRSVTT